MTLAQTDARPRPPRSLAGARVTVMGLGRFGGGLGAARWLAAQGARVLVTDRKPASEFVDALAELDPDIRRGAVGLRLGEHRESDFTDTDLVVANPAVPTPWKNPYLNAARAAGVPITTEIGLLIDRLGGHERTVGITGTAGKSTTTSMIAHALTASGFPTVLGGNIGGSLLDRLPIAPETWVVLELSSAMLSWLSETSAWSPRVAVCTNISANHADWHGSDDHYRASKQTLLAHQRPGDSAILGPGLEQWGTAPGVRVVNVTSPLEGSLAIPGAHNRLNAALALAACRAAEPSVDPERFASGLRSFPGLEHRLQLCHTSRDGKRFYNDSKCTTIAAMEQALASLAEESGGSLKHVHLIAGGDAKGQDLAPVGRRARDLAHLWCVGRDGHLAHAAAPSGTSDRFDTLDQLVPAAIAQMKPGDALLLSPACASWDQFPNYEHRGRRFIELVKKHAP